MNKSAGSTATSMPASTAEFVIRPSHRHYYLHSTFVNTNSLKAGLGTFTDFNESRSPFIKHRRPVAVQVRIEQTD